MQFMIIRKADESTEAGVLPTTEQLEVMGTYNQEMADAGVLVDGAGLHPTTAGTRISFRDGEPTISDGPFAEAKETIAGFTMIEVASHEEALEWVKKWPEANVDLELRRVFGEGDFGEAFTPELREREDQLRNQLASERAQNQTH